MIEKIAIYVKKYFKDTTIGDWVINFIRIRGIDEKMLSVVAKKKYRKDVVNPSEEMVASRQYFKEHKEQIKSIVDLLADKESKICYRKAVAYRCTHDMKQAPKYTKNIYFPEDIIHLSEEEVFIDGGAFVGDTIRTFYRIVNGKYKRIVAFEPDTYNFRMLTKLKYHNVIRKNVGLWNSNEKLHFSDGGGCGSNISVDAVSTVEVKKMDDIDACQDATFIKMDIEGSEFMALIGAENIIRRNHPKLAICIYHSDEDMLRIIEYIHEIEPEYLIYVRHHSAYAAETVMYAVYKAPND